jgi:hypothetical protein
MEKVAHLEFRNLYSSPDNIKQMKSRGMRWAGHVLRMGEEKSVQGFDGKARREKYHLENGSVDGRMGLEWFLRRLAGGRGVWNGFTWLMIGNVGGLL